MKRWDGGHYVQLRAFQNELYCIEIDFKIYIGGCIWQIKDNTITLIYGKKRCCNGGRQGKRNEIDFEIDTKNTRCGQICIISSAAGILFIQRYFRNHAHGRNDRTITV